MELLTSHDIDAISGAWGYKDAISLGTAIYKLQNWVGDTMTSTGQGPFGQSTGNDFFDALNGGNLGA